jgi:hypothetical protein
MTTATLEIEEINDTRLLTDQISEDYIKGRYDASDNDWSFILVDKISTPGFEWTDDLIESLRVQNDALEFSFFRIADRGAKQYLSRVNCENNDPELPATRYGDREQLWTCPFGLLVFWKGDYLHAHTTRPPVQPVSNEWFNDNKLVGVRKHTRGWDPDHERDTSLNETYRRDYFIINTHNTNIQVWSTFKILRKLFNISIKYNTDFDRMTWFPPESSRQAFSVENASSAYGRNDIIRDWESFENYCLYERDQTRRYINRIAHRTTQFQWHLGGLCGIKKYFNFDYDEMNNFLREYNKSRRGRDRNKRPWDSYYTNVPTRGMKRLAELFDTCLSNLFVEEPVLYCLLSSFIMNIKLKHQDIPVTQLYNVLFKDVTNYGELKERLKRIWNDNEHQFNSNADNKLNNLVMYIFDNMPELPILRVQKEERQLKNTFKKLCSYAGCTVETATKKYPKFTKMFHDNEITMQMFQRNGTRHLFNTRLDLWEKMIKRHPEFLEVVIVNTHRHYKNSKNLTGYFEFILHEFPKYLKKHTGHKWTINPSYTLYTWDSVTSADMYPGKMIVDNENKIITVPYCVEAVNHSSNSPQDWVILKRGMKLDGDVCRNETEVINNNKYGMFYNTTVYTCNGRMARHVRLYLMSFKDEGNIDIIRVSPPNTGYGFKPLSNWIQHGIKYFTRNQSYDVQLKDVLFKRIEEERVNSILRQHQWIHAANRINDWETSSDIRTSSTYISTDGSVIEVGRGTGTMFQVMGDTHISTGAGQVTLSPGIYEANYTAVFDGARTQINNVPIQLRYEPMTADQAEQQIRQEMARSLTEDIDHQLLEDTPMDHIDYNLD